MKSAPVLTRQPPEFPVNDLRKYPRTQHLEGSRLQPGDHDLAQVPLRELDGRHVVIEEKVDGANCAISFDSQGRLLTQSRGHFLTGGGRERQFDLLKTWAAAHRDSLWPVLGERYVMYGEWLFAKHTIFYDALPHYFLEFDVLDRRDGEFLSTRARRELLSGLPVASVPVLFEGPWKGSALDKWVAQSAFKSGGWRERLVDHARANGQDVERVATETDASPLMEGLYIKWEEGGRVQGRYKYIRSSFLTAVLDSGSHWQDRPILPNLLVEGTRLW